MRGLTERQEQVLLFIREHLREHGRPPTLRVIGAHLGIRSTNGVNDHLRALERKGRVRRDDHRACGIVLVEPTKGRAPKDVNQASAEEVRRHLDALEKLPMSRLAQSLLSALRVELLDTCARE